MLRMWLSQDRNFLPGITAVRSAEVLDIMCSDFPEKYEEFRRYMREKQMKELSFKQRGKRTLRRC